MLYFYPLKTSENQRFSEVLGGIGEEHWLEMGQMNLCQDF